MGAYNELVLNTKLNLRIQFKHGMCWQYEYQLGEKIKWDHLVRPEAANGEIRVAGVSRSDEAGKFLHFEILIENDVIKSIRGITEKHYEELDALNSA